MCITLVVSIMEGGSVELCCDVFASGCGCVVLYSVFWGSLSRRLGVVSLLESCLCGLHEEAVL